MSPGRRLGLLWLLLAALGWGLNWPALKLLLQEAPPLFARGTAGLVAALCLAAVAAARGERLALRRADLLPLVVAALVNVLAWMGFPTVSMQWLTVAEGALLVYSMPIWVLLLAWPIRGEPPSVRGIAGVVLGVGGLAVLLGDVPAGAGKLPGILLSLTAAFLFALGTVVWRSALTLPPLSAVAWQVGLGCLPMVIAGLAFEAPDPALLSARAWACWAYMAVMPMAICYLAWFAALRHLPATAASTGTLLTPVIGVVGAALILSEPFELKEAAALTLTLTGVALALRRS